MSARKRQSRPKSRVLFMHTIGGVPASFDPIHHVIHRSPVERLAVRPVALCPANLAGSIEQVMAERVASRRSLRRLKMAAPRYGYVAVVVPV